MTYVVYCLYYLIHYNLHEYNVLSIYKRWFLNDIHKNVSICECIIVKIDKKKCIFTQMKNTKVYQLEIKIRVICLVL